jgi:hypothetical protein
MALKGPLNIFPALPGAKSHLGQRFARAGERILYHEQPSAPRQLAREQSRLIVSTLA